MLNLCTKFTEIHHVIIWLKNTCGEYIARCEYIKDDHYLLEGGDTVEKWIHVNINPIKNG